MSHCSRRVDTFNVPSPSSHYRPPYVYAWTTFSFFFSNSVHPQCMQSGKHGRLQHRLGWKEGRGPTRGRLRGFIAAHTIFICREVTRERSTWSAKQLVSQILSRLRKRRWSKYVSGNGSFHNGTERTFKTMTELVLCLLVRSVHPP